MEKPMEIGSVVFSRAGRDKGIYFMVYEIVDSDFVTLVDGDVRKLNKPKKKKIKHVKNTDTVLENIAQKVKDKSTVYDAEIFSALKKFNL